MGKFLRGAMFFWWLQKFCFALTFALLLLPFLFVSLSAQRGDSVHSPSPFSTIVLCAGGGYVWGKAFGEFPVFRGSADCGLFVGGEERGGYAAAEFRLPMLFGSTIGGRVRLDLSFASQQFSATPIDPQQVFDQVNGTTVELIRQYRFLSSFTTASLDFLVSYQLGERLSLYAGPSLGYRSSGTFEQYDEVLGPNDFLFDDGEVRHTMLDGIPFTLRAVGFGGVVGAGYTFPVGDRLSFEPSISVRLDIPGPVSEMKRSTLSGRAGISFVWDISPSHGSDKKGNDSIPAPSSPVASLLTDDVPASDSTVDDIETSASDVSTDDVSSEAVAPKDFLPDSDNVDTANADTSTKNIAPLRATLDVYSVQASAVRSDTAVIPMQSFREKRFVVLLPRLYFEQGHSDLPSRYVLFSADEAAAFTLSSIADPTPELVNNQALNIIGKRLKENLGTAITLSGRYSVDEPSELAGERVNSVAEYLKKIWGIAPERITVAEAKELPDPVVNGTPEGREEERFVAMQCFPDDLAAPVVVEQLAREFHPPVIKIVPRITAEAGVKEWEIVIRREGKEVARYNTKAPSGEQAGIPWNTVAGDGKASATTLVAELFVQDKNGAEQSVQDTLPVVFVPYQVGGEESERLLFFLPGFQGESVPEEDVRQEAENIADHLHAGGHIRVRPRYSGTDRFATERSLALATALAKSLAGRAKERGIATDDIVVETSGSEENISGADSTEARIASRGVLVIIE